MAKPKEILPAKTLSYHAADDKNILLLIAAVREGISYPYFVSVSRQSPFSESEWALFLNLSERTLQRYKREKKSFEPVQSEKIMQVMMLYKYGVEVFGSSEKLDLWLSAPNLALGDKKPKEFLDNSFGISMVKDELTRIEYGVLA
jgi:putative toxin-antitoxin system antitoxin component (TIGR02293 family)